jgi:hypothetical protein
MVSLEYVRHELAYVRGDGYVRFTNADARRRVAHMVAYHPASNHGVLPIKALQRYQILKDESFLAILAGGFELSPWPPSGVICQNALLGEFRSSSPVLLRDARQYGRVVPRASARSCAPRMRAKNVAVASQCNYIGPEILPDP